MREKKNAAERRSDIVQAALKLFFTKGYEKTAVEDVAKEAGIAKGSFYLHFQSKRELLDACVGHLAEGLLGAFADCLRDASKTPRERLRAYVECNFAYAARAEGNRFAQLLHAPTFADQHDRVMSAGIHKMLPLFTALIEEGAAESGFIVQDAQTSAAAILGALRQLHDTLGQRDDMPPGKKKELTYGVLSCLLGVDLWEGDAQ